MSQIPIEELPLSTVTKEAKNLAKRFKAVGVEIPLSKCQEVYVQGQGWKNFHDFQKARKEHDLFLKNDESPKVISNACCEVCGSQVFTAGIANYGDAYFDEEGDWIEDFDSCEDSSNSYSDYRACYICGSNESSNLELADYELDEIVAYSGQKGQANIDLKESGQIWVALEHEGHISIHTLKRGLDLAHENGLEPFFILATLDINARRAYKAAIKQAEADPENAEFAGSLKKRAAKTSAKITAHFKDLETGYESTFDVSGWVKATGMDELEAILHNNGEYQNVEADVEHLAKTWFKDLEDLLAARRVHIKNQKIAKPKDFTFTFNCEELENWIKLNK